jgi:formamidopyrimidine-DNA glycosylase
MKNISKLSILVLMLVFASCKDAKTEATTETTTIENSDNTEGQLYACPMHPEVTGKQGEECSKCGMELTEQLLIKG